MNVVKEITQINLRELEGNGAGSWHDTYKDSAYIFVGGLPFNLTEGDVIAICSQYGEIADINLPRDKETGRPRGFAFVMYLDQRSTVLAVDNLNGSKVLGRTLRVDHTRNYEQPKGRDEDGEVVEPEEQSMNALPSMVGGPSARGAIEAGGEDVDEEDPMAAYIRSERLRESLEASTSSSSKPKKDKKDKKDKEHKHKHRDPDKPKKDKSHRDHHSNRKDRSDRDRSESDRPSSSRYDRDRSRSRSPRRDRDRSDRDAPRRRSRSPPPPPPSGGARPAAASFFPPSAPPRGGDDRDGGAARWRDVPPPAREERPRSDREREREWPREDRFREDRSREDRPRDDRPREDRSREDRPRERSRWDEKERR